MVNVSRHQLTTRNARKERGLGVRVDLVVRYVPKVLVQQRKRGPAYKDDEGCITLHICGFPRDTKSPFGVPIT